MWGKLDAEADHQVTGIERKTLVSKVSDALLEHIRDGGYRPGDAIPGSSTLADRFDVSIPVLREAISELVGRGVLSRSQGKATLVRAPSSDDLERMLRSRVHSVPGQFDDMMDFREVIEVGAARLAADSAGPDDIAELRAIHDRMSEQSAAEDFLNVDVEFHWAVAKAAHNDLILMIMEAMSTLLREHRRQGWAGWVQLGHNASPIFAAHGAVLAAIESHDADAAGRAMVDHLQQPRRGLKAQADVSAMPSAITW